jgi:hypothetical protein
VPAATARRATQLVGASLGIFTVRSRLRMGCVWLSTCPPFTWAVLLVILANSVALGLLDFSPDAVTDLAPDPAKSWRNALEDTLDPIFTSIFVVEMCVRGGGGGASALRRVVGHTHCQRRVARVVWHARAR